MLILSSLGCGTPSDSESPTMESDQVTGSIQDVRHKSLIRLDYIILKTPDGSLFKFKGHDEIFPGFTPSHLRDHMLSGISVTVRFHREGNDFVIDSITD